VNQVLCKNDNIIWRIIEGETVLLDPISGRYFGLNAVGCSFWEKVNGSLSLREIADQMLQEYEVEEEVLTGDILELVSSMKAQGLLILK